MAASQGLDKHALYQETVQFPPEDIHWMLRFHHRYIGGHPWHLREDFCGSAFLSATWCRQDVKRSATGVDLHGNALQYALQHNCDGCGDRLCLVQANVLQSPASGKLMRQPAAGHMQQTQQAPAATSPSAAAATNEPQQQQVGFDLPSEPEAAASAEAGDPQTLTLEAADAEAASAAVAAHGSGASGQAAKLHFDHRSPSARAADLDTPVSDATTISVPPAGAFGVYVFGELELAAADDLLLRPADIICALNFGVCLLHMREEVLQYFRQVRSSLAAPGVFVADLMGGRAVECTTTLERTHSKTGLRYTFEQSSYNPLTRHLRCHISLQDPASKQVLRHAFTHRWRLWSVQDVVEMLKQAGFSAVAVWVRPLKADDDEDADASSSGSSSDGSVGDDALQAALAAAEVSADDDAGGDAAEEGEMPYVEYSPATATPAFLGRLAKGWTAYVVGVGRGVVTSEGDAVVI